MMITTPQLREIRTQRLLLRGALASDAPALHECFSNPELMRYWSTTPHKSLLDTEKWLTSMITNPQNGHLDFLIIDPTTTHAIGKIGIWSGNEIGFMIHRSYWRRGFISEALAAVLPLFLKEFESITADTDPRNEGSILVLKKFGFVEMGRRERTFMVGEEWVDSLDLCLTRENWDARQKSGT